MQQRVIGIITIIGIKRKIVHPIVTIIKHVIAALLLGIVHKPVITTQAVGGRNNGVRANPDMLWCLAVVLPVVI